MTFSMLGVKAYRGEELMASGSLRQVFHCDIDGVPSLNAGPIGRHGHLGSFRIRHASPELAVTTPI
jgi:hypothetical protein